MTLGRRQQLEIVEIVFFAPCVFVASFAAFRQGRGRISAWILLAVLSAVRIAGSACDIAGHQGASNATNLVVAGTVLNGIGLTFAVSSVLRLLERVNENMEERVPPRLMRYINLPLVVAIVLSIVGGNKAADYNDPSSVKSSQSFFKATSIILLVVCLGITVLAIWLALRISHIIPTERRFLFGCSACLPLLFIWVVYTIISAFDPDSSAFNRRDPSVWAQAFMIVVEEFLILLILLPIGILTHPPPRNQDREGNYKEGDVELEGAPSRREQRRERRPRGGPISMLTHALNS